MRTTHLQQATCDLSLVIWLPGSASDWGWSGGAMVLGKLPVPGRPTNLDYSRARAYCACSRFGWGRLDIFSLIYLFSFLSPSLWETARYRLKYCLKGPLSPKQPTDQNQLLIICSAFVLLSFICLIIFSIFAISLFFCLTIMVVLFVSSSDFSYSVTSITCKL